MAKLERAGEIDVAPWPRLRLIAELVVGFGKQRLCFGVVRVREDQVVQHLRCPTVLPSIERCLCVADQRFGASGQLHVFLSCLDGRERIEIRWVAVEPSKVALVDCLRVVAERAVVAAIRKRLL